MPTCSASPGASEAAPFVARPGVARAGDAEAQAQAHCRKAVPVDRWRPVSSIVCRRAFSGVEAFKACSEIFHRHRMAVRANGFISVRQAPED